MSKVVADLCCFVSHRQMPVFERDTKLGFQLLKRLLKPFVSKDRIYLIRRSEPCEIDKG